MFLIDLLLCWTIVTTPYGFSSVVVPAWLRLKLFSWVLNDVGLAGDITQMNILSYPSHCSLRMYPGFWTSGRCCLPLTTNDCIDSNNPSVHCHTELSTSYREVVPPTAAVSLFMLQWRYHRRLIIIVDLFVYPLKSRKGVWKNTYREMYLDALEVCWFVVAVE